MSLVQRSNRPTNYVLPVKIINSNKETRVNFYYEDYRTLWRAFYQLKKLHLNIVPLYPVIYEEEGAK